jgi:hypothetical protein
MARRCRWRSDRGRLWVAAPPKGHSGGSGSTWSKQARKHRGFSRVEILAPGIADSARAGAGDRVSPDRRRTGPDLGPVPARRADACSLRTSASRAPSNWPGPAPDPRRRTHGTRGRAPAASRRPVHSSHLARDPPGRSSRSSERRKSSTGIPFRLPRVRNADNARQRGRASEQADRHMRDMA